MLALIYPQGYLTFDKKQLLKILLIKQGISRETYPSSYTRASNSDMARLSITHMSYDLIKKNLK